MPIGETIQELPRPLQLPDLLQQHGAGDSSYRPDFGRLVPAGTPKLRPIVPAGPDGWGEHPIEAHPQQSGQASARSHGSAMGICTAGAGLGPLPTGPATDSPIGETLGDARLELAAAPRGSYTQACPFHARQFIWHIVLRSEKVTNL